MDKEAFLSTVESLHLAGKDEELLRFLELAPLELRANLNERERALLNRAAHVAAMGAGATRRGQPASSGNPAA